MQVFDVLSPNQKIKGLLFLEAAAGCGKTFAIEHIISRLLIEEEITFDKCLVVTFTKAAALDLKRRIFTTLSEIEKKLLFGRIEDLNIPYLDQFKDPKKILMIVQKGLETLNLATISTIHGFCYAFLTQQAFFVDLPLENSKQLNLEQLIQDVIRSLSKEEFPAIWLKQFGQGLEGFDESITKAILPYLGSDLDFEAIVSFENFYQKFLDLFFSLKIENRRDQFLNFQSDLESFNGIFSKDKKIKYLKEVGILKELFEIKMPSKSFFEVFLTTKDLLEKIQEENLTKKVDKDLEAKKRAKVWIEFFQPFYALLDGCLNLSNIVLALTAKVQEALKKEFQSNPLSHPDFILKQMAECVEDERVVQTLRKQYQVVLIDEFQDTDPFQWKIFHRAFFESQQLKLFACVGDPKQSIYGFRNADISIYLKAKEVFPEKDRYILDTNFRSEKALIESINQCFLSEGNFEFFNFSQSPYRIDYFPIHFFHEKLWFPQDHKLALHFILSRGKTYKNIEEEFFFPYFANEVKSLKMQGIELDQIAFLVKDRYQANRLKEALESYGIRFSPLKNEKIQETESYQLILFILEWIEEVHSNHAFKKVLFHPYVRKEHFFDTEFIESGYLKLKSNILSRLNQNFLLADFPKILSLIFENLEIEETILRNKSALQFDEMSQVKEIAVQFAVQSSNFSDLKMKFLDLSIEKTLEQDGLKKRVTHEEKTPALVTMHSSKGLEYDVVFILGLYIPTNMKSLLFKTQEGKLTSSKSCKVDLHEIPIDMEKMRQFYVALTRAKKRVYLPIPFEEKKSKISPSEMAPIDLFLKKKIWQSCDYETLYHKDLSYEEIQNFIASNPLFSSEEIFSSLPQIELISEDLQLKNCERPLEFVCSEKNLNVFSFSSLSLKQSEVKIELPDQENIGALFGTFFHELVEKLIESRLYDQTEGAIFHKWLKKRLILTPYEDDFIEIAEMLHLCMTSPILPHGLAIKDLPYQCIIPEMKLQLKISPEKELKGFIDLLVYFDGIYTVIDFKTNYLGDDASSYELESLKSIIQKKEYALQAACYMNALERFHELNSEKSFEEAFDGVIFIFTRGLKYSQGIIKLNEIHELKERFKDAILSRT